MPNANVRSERTTVRPPAAIEPIAMRVPDACRFTGISRSTLYVLISRQEIEIIKLGSTTLVVTESLRRLIDARRQSGRNAALGS